VSLWTGKSSQSYWRGPDLEFRNRLEGPRWTGGGGGGRGGARGQGAPSHRVVN
jgi:hypothetical protein